MQNALPLTSSSRYNVFTQSPVISLNSKACYTGFIPIILYAEPGLPLYLLKYINRLHKESTCIAYIQNAVFRLHAESVTGFKYRAGCPA